MKSLFSNEIVFPGHPDKVCDQIGDAILDEFLKQDENTRAGIEVTGGKNVIFITGEINTRGHVDVTKVALDILAANHYDPTNYRVIDNIGKQSDDISMGVDVGGAGDQGMMFGYACRDNDLLLPNAMVILQDISRGYVKLLETHSRFLPDGKAMLTGVYNGRELVDIESILISYQVLEENRHITDPIIIDMIQNIVKKYGYEISSNNILINPTGKFEIGGFDGDAGVLGRKIVVDGYHGFYHVGGGAQSGKDGTKVDRSGAYKARQIAKRVVGANNDIDWCEVQISYAIGVERPMSIMINTNKGIIQPNESLYEECKPQQIIRDLNLKSPDFIKTSRFGHFGGDFAWENI